MVKLIVIWHIVEALKILLDAFDFTLLIFERNLIMERDVFNAVQDWAVVRLMHAASRPDRTFIGQLRENMGILKIRQNFRLSTIWKRLPDFLNDFAFLLLKMDALKSHQFFFCIHTAQDQQDIHSGFRPQRQPIFADCVWIQKLFLLRLLYL